MSLLSVMTPVPMHWLPQWFVYFGPFSVSRLPEAVYQYFSFTKAPWFSELAFVPSRDKLYQSHYFCRRHSEPVSVLCQRYTVPASVFYQGQWAILWYLSVLYWTISIFCQENAVSAPVDCQGKWCQALLCIVPVSVVCQGFTVRVSVVYLGCIV